MRKSNLFNDIADGARLASVEYEKGLSLMLVLEKPSALPLPGCLKLENGQVSWIADNSKKRGFPKEHCITVQADPKFADYAWNRDNEEVAQAMIRSIKKLLGSKVVDWHIHRWLYAFAKNPLKSKSYHDANMHLSIAGDAFVSSRVESAALSGLHAADTLIELLK